MKGYKCGFFREGNAEVRTLELMVHWGDKGGEGGGSVRGGRWNKKQKMGGRERERVRGGELSSKSDA